MGKYYISCEPLHVIINADNEFDAVCKAWLCHADKYFTENISTMVMVNQKGFNNFKQTIYHTDDIHKVLNNK